MGGSTELPSITFALASCYNVLDHTEKDELKEIARILRPGGYLLLECDVLSFFSLLKHHIFRIYDAAHPHKFSSKALCKMVTQSGFRILAVNSRKYELLHQICGKLFVV
jgi:SAM-dependent methyltransferase